jgi:hypothetical protein
VFRIVNNEPAPSADPAEVVDEDRNQQGGDHVPRVAFGVQNAARATWRRKVPQARPSSLPRHTVAGRDWIKAQFLNDSRDTMNLDHFPSAGCVFTRRAAVAFFASRLQRDRDAGAIESFG